MKVFGIGLSRTGTLSLNQALEMLGYRAAHFPSDPITRLQFRRHFGSNCPRIKLSILERYDAITDTTATAIYKALDRSYPDSRFILTVRDKAAWLASCNRMFRQVLTPMLRRHPENRHGQWLALVAERVYGTVNFDPAAYSRTFDLHHQNVLEHFAARTHDLLVMDICAGDGWDKLAPFLSVEPPTLPFPHLNRIVTD